MLDRDQAFPTYSPRERYQPTSLAYTTTTTVRFEPFLDIHSDEIKFRVMVVRAIENYAKVVSGDVGGFNGKWGTLKTRLLVFVLSLDEDVVVYASQKAFKSLPNVSKSISELMALKGRPSFSNRLNSRLQETRWVNAYVAFETEDSAQASLAHNMSVGDVGTYLVTPPMPAIGGREDVGELHSLGSTT
ncbi:hypothetical protein Tco_1090998 [Tanacetum coccineum]|uniref:Uncharacterized protein n=1 Tax=Tanacetum coccineum TaxID=301880 RepID=A0ABQ5I5V6_9ASTR